MNRSSPDAPSKEQWITSIVAISIILLFAAYLLTYDQAKSTTQDSSVLQIESKLSYLDQFCSGYSLSREDAIKEIRYELSEYAQASGIHGFVDLPKMGDHATTTAYLIETARVCGGYTPAALELDEFDLVIAGLMKASDVRSPGRLP